MSAKREAPSRRDQDPSAKREAPSRRDQDPSAKREAPSRRDQDPSAPESGLHLQTLAVHGGERRPGPEGSVVFPIYQGTVFAVDADTGYHDIKYIRLNSTPSQVYLHDKLASLEGAEAALATASGMAAVTGILLSLLRSGDHFIAGDCLYGGTHSFITEHASDLGWQATFVDAQRPETWKAALTPRTRLFLTETITNPLMRVPVLDEVVAFARAHDLVSVVDNTFATPINFRPLAAGFDLAFHSATKYLNGHSDLVAGCVVGSAARVEAIRRTLNHYGASLDPHAGFLLARGLKTLALRVAAHNANAGALAAFLAEAPAVAEVNYPALASHPDHEHASRLLAGFGGMLSLRLQGGVAAAERLTSRLRLPSIAPSLGGVETLVTRPALTSHAAMSVQDRRQLGVTDDLIRISCGIEHPADLLEDFRQAIDR